jgi:Putative prokaryotic signal transducing protein
VSEDLAVVETVGTEFEADAVCGLLREAGIECNHRGATSTGGVLGGVGQGVREVVVRAEDAERARAALAEDEAET